MSFLSKVLSVANEVSLETIKQKVSILSVNLCECKRETEEFILDGYHRFLVWPVKNQKLIDITGHFSSQLSDLQGQIDSMSGTEIEDRKKELVCLSADLERLRIDLDVTVRLVRSNELLCDIRDLQENDRLLEKTRWFVRLENCLEPIHVDKATDAVTFLSLYIMREKVSLSEKITNLFDEHIQYKRGTKLTNCQTNYVRVIGGAEDLSRLFTILALFKNLKKVLDELSQFLWEHICKPIFCNTVIVRLDNDNELTIVIKKGTANSSYRDAFDKLIVVFTFIHKKLRYFVDEIKIVTYIGTKIKNELLEMILKCVKNATLTDTDNLIDEITSFETNLKRLEILDASSSSPFLNPTNLDRMAIDDECKKYFDNAVALLKTNVLDTEIVGVVHDEDDPDTWQAFPKSVVSKNTIEIVDLMEELLVKATSNGTSSLLVAGLVRVTQNVFQQYGNVVQVYHTQLLEASPKAAAVFHNNCNFVAFRLIHLNKIYSPMLSNVIVPATRLFPSQREELRSIGSRTFLHCVNNYVKRLELALREGFKSQKPDSDIEKSIRCCMEEFKTLKLLWFDVLPSFNYNKTLGQMLNWFCKQLIETVPDITNNILSENRHELSKSYKFVRIEAPKLFGSPQEINQYVTVWQKFEDLIFVLSASLSDVEYKWARGKGPLASTFKPDEIKHLVKAFFKTDLSFH